MGVFIKSMEMPNNCYDCPFIRASYAGDYYCAKGNGTEEDLKKVYSQRMADCPLVEIPTPHGRLIDADELKTAFPRCDNSIDIKVASVRATINHAPIIIEAEGMG